jgi:gliding motility-associated-like protein
VRKFRNHYIKPIRFYSLKITICFLFTHLFIQHSFAQGCPPNIDFEDGTFAGWTCYTGSVAAINNQNVINLFQSGGPVGNQHTMYSAASSANETDFYGGFPVICPNGSGYSVKLGNNSGGAGAEGISYEFTIPANRNNYSLIYHYAVVFQDPNHLAFQQPRLELEITNVTDNSIINCSSFTFIPNGSALPGFYQSSNSDSTTVWCKDWSAVTINLNGNAGKTIRLFFKTADCTFVRHFGYAYIDVNTECSDEFVGATFCRDDTAVNVIAPYGYQNYTWYNSTFTQTLGFNQQIRFEPPPQVGSVIAVQIEPYAGFGCLDTLYARLIDTLTLRARAGADALSCNATSLQLGENPRQGVIYSWSPSAGLSNPAIANPRAGPNITTQYILSVRNSGGGCANDDTVIVTASVIDSSLRVFGANNFCSTSEDSAVLVIQPVLSIQWYKDNVPIPGANGPRYRAIQAGTYFARLVNADGCNSITRSEQVFIEDPRPGIRYPEEYAIKNSPIQLEARTFGQTVLWKPPTYLDDIDITNPYFESPVENSVGYTIDITTAAGCLTVDTQVVKTIKEVKIFVPTGFTPNNDGLNDFLKPMLYGIKEFRFFRIYNRWGQLVFDMRNNQLGWNGKIAGVLQPTNSFVWIVQGVGLDNKIYTEKGSTVLIR